MTERWIAQVNWLGSLLFGGQIASASMKERQSSLHRLDASGR